MRRRRRAGALEASKASEDCRGVPQAGRSVRRARGQPSWTSAHKQRREAAPNRGLESRQELRTQLRDGYDGCKGCGGLWWWLVVGGGARWWLVLVGGG